MVIKKKGGRSMPDNSPFTRYETEPICSGLDSYIYRYHSAYRPKLYFCCTGKEYDKKEDNLYMGFELEFDAPNKKIGCRNNKISVIDFSNHIFNSNTYLYYMLDGSIRNGLEMISQPSTLDFYKQNEEKFKQLFSFIKNVGFEARKSCGFHIHFNRDYIMSQSGIYDEYYKDNEEKLIMIVEKFWKELVYISKRQYSRIERWSNKFDKTPKEIVDNMSFGVFEDKYHVLNFNNRQTIEFRLYSSSLEYEDFICYLELYSNIINAAKNLTKKQIEEINFSYFLDTKELVSYYIEQTSVAKIRKYKKYLETT